MTSPFALVGEVRRIFDGPIALSGAIANGGSILAAQAMGADFATSAHALSPRARRTRGKRYKSAILGSKAADIIYTNLFTGVHGNYIRQSILNAGLDPDALPASDKGAMNSATQRSRPKRGRKSGARDKASA